jgi:hypothetical protein
VVTIVLAACGGARRTGGSDTVRVIESAQRAPDLMRRTGDGTLVSRALLAEPEMGSARISLDGTFYSLAERGIGAALLHVGRIGAAPHRLFWAREMAWVGAHTIIYRQHDAWYRADADDDSFIKFTSSKIADVADDERRDATLVRVSPDGNRVILSLPTDKDRKKRSPWVYDVRTREAKELLHNTRYDQILIDEQERPVFAVDRDPKHGLQLFERTDRGWLERTVDLPPKTIEIFEVVQGKLGLALGSEESPRFVTWDPVKKAIADSRAPGVSQAVRDNRNRLLLTRSGRTWSAVVPMLAPIAAELTLLGVDIVDAATDRFWTASASAGERRVHYAVDVDARTIRALGPHRDRRALPELEQQNVQIGSDATSLTVYAGVAPVHGVVFYGGYMDWLYRDELFQLLTSRGYHVLAAMEDENLGSVNEAHVAWARSTFGDLPIACLDITLDCMQVAGVVAVIHDERTPWAPPYDGVTSKVNELRLGAGYLRARSLAQYDEELEYIRTEVAPARDQAPVVGIGLRGRESWLESRFALIEGFLGQHLGGRVEPMVWSELLAAGVKVAYGMSKVPFLEGRNELLLTALSNAEREELVAGFAILLGTYRDAFAQGCAGVAERVAKLRLPAALTKYRQSNEYLVLQYQFQEDRRDRNARACEEENAADNAIREIVNR